MATSTAPEPKRKPKKQQSERIKIDPSLYQLPPKVYIESRNGSPRLYVRAFIGGKSRIKTTGEATLGAAVRKAQDIYLDWMIVALRAGNLPTLPGGPAPVPFARAYQSFIARAERIQKVTPAQIKNYKDKWTLLKPELETLALTAITTDWLEQLRATRKASTHVRSVTKSGKVVVRERKKPVSNSTLKKDFDFIRMVLKHARDHDKTLPTVPTFPEFEGRVWRVKNNQRPFLPPAVWNKVKRQALAQASEPNLNPRTRRQRQELYSFIMLCVGAALRPSEAYSLRWKDCRLGTLGTNTPCVRLWVHGKHAKHADENIRERGWALNDGVVGFKYLQKVYPNADPNAKLLTEEHADGMKRLLESSGLREDVVTGMTRDSKSLRSTGISLRLQETNPSHNDIALWARTHPKHIADFYDQVDPDWKIRRMAALDEETPRERKSRELREKVRKQMAREAMMDNDDVYGVGENDDLFEEHLSTKSRAQLRVVSRQVGGSW